MREIKFRQYLSKTSFPFHYYGWIGGQGGFTGPVSKNNSPYEGDQYTGMKDKNGTNIYEGDIVQTTAGGDGTRGRIIWDHGQCCFLFRYKLKKQNTHNSRDQMLNVLGGHTGEFNVKVIGNIYENSDLLKETN